MFYRCIIAIFVVLAVFHLWQENYFVNSLQELKNVVLKYRKIMFFMLALFFIILGFADLPISGFINSHIDVYWLSIFSKISLSADSLYLVPMVVMLIALSQDYLLKFLQYRYSKVIKFNIEKLIIVSKISLTSLLLSGATNGVLKIFFSRQRPSIGLDNWYIFSIFYNQNCHLKDLSYACNSLPSGHSIVAISFIMPIIWSYKNNSCLKYLLLSWYILIVFCRIYTLNHWPSDVFFASCLGYIIANVCYSGNKHKLGIISGI
jgi:membrane-associated phospholipid phosphatase